MTDVINLIKSLSRYELDRLEIRYWYNMCKDIEEIPIIVLQTIKQKLRQYKKLLKLLKMQEKSFDDKINFECGSEIFCYEDYIQNITTEMLLELVTNTKTEPEKLNTLVSYTESITKIQNQICNISHIIALYESIIYNTWKKHYSKNNYYLIQKINYNIFYIKL